MDPLSVSASIVALLTLSSTVIKYLTEVNDAPESSKKILIEISLTRGILDSVQLSTQGATLELLKEPLHQFELTLKFLKNKLVLGARRHDRLKQAIEWPFKKGNVEEILKSLERQKSLFLLALQNDQR